MLHRAAPAPQTRSDLGGHHIVLGSLAVKLSLKGFLQSSCIRWGLQKLGLFSSGYAEGEAPEFSQ